MKEIDHEKSFVSDICAYTDILQVAGENLRIGQEEC